MPPCRQEGKRYSHWIMDKPRKDACKLDSIERYAKLVLARKRELMKNKAVRSADRWDKLGL